MAVIYITLERPLLAPLRFGESDHNGEATILTGQAFHSFCTMENHFRLSKGDHNGEVTVLVR